MMKLYRMIRRVMARLRRTRPPEALDAFSAEEAFLQAARWRTRRCRRGG
jgi:hypothetical protein